MSDRPDNGMAEISGLPSSPIILVFDMARSLAFWRDLLGFSVIRRSDKAVQLGRRPVGIMLRQRGAEGEGQQVDPPFGCGVTLRFALDNYDEARTTLLKSGWPVYGGPQAAWRRVRDGDALQREAFVQDPDGYLLQLTQRQGEELSIEGLLHALVHQDSFGGTILRRRQGGAWHYYTIVGCTAFGLDQGLAEADGAEEVVPREQALALVSIEQFHLLRHLTASRGRAFRHQR